MVDALVGAYDFIMADKRHEWNHGAFVRRVNTDYIHSRVAGFVDPHDNLVLKPYKKSPSCLSGYRRSVLYLSVAKGMEVLGDAKGVQAVPLIGCGVGTLKCLTDHLSHCQAG